MQRTSGTLGIAMRRCTIHVAAMEPTNSKETEMNPQQHTTLIIGGNGKTGSRVAQRLTARGLPVRLASRSTSPAFDWEDSSTWVPALQGIESIYLTYFPDLAVPSAAE